MSSIGHLNEEDYVESGRECCYRKIAALFWKLTVSRIPDWDNTDNPALHAVPFITVLRVVFRRSDQVIYWRTFL